MHRRMMDNLCVLPGLSQASWLKGLKYLPPSFWPGFKKLAYCCFTHIFLMPYVLHVLNWLINYVNHSFTTKKVIVILKKKKLWIQLFSYRYIHEKEVWTKRFYWLKVWLFGECPENGLNQFAYPPPKICWRWVNII